MGRLGLRAAGSALKAGGRTGFFFRFRSVDSSSCAPPIAHSTAAAARVRTAVEAELERTIAEPGGQCLRGRISAGRRGAAATCLSAEAVRCWSEGWASRAGSPAFQFPRMKREEVTVSQDLPAKASVKMP